MMHEIRLNGEPVYDAIITILSEDMDLICSNRDFMASLISHAPS